VISAITINESERGSEMVFIRFKLFFTSVLIYTP
jgi:hypothetical protein